MKQQFEFIKDEHERQFVKQVACYYEQSQQQWRPLFTDFHNVDWMKSVMARYFLGFDEANYTFFGGYEGAERQIAIFCPYPLEKDAYGIKALKLEVKTSVGKPPDHRDYLGAILGTGIKRERIGDIILKPFGAYVMAEEAIADYLLLNLTAIGRYRKIELNEIPFDALEIEPPRTKECQLTVSSLRADAVAAQCFGISRGECAKLIQGEKLRVNGHIVQASAVVNEGDTLTLRGYGKIEFVAVNGMTKKERLHITVKKYI